MFAETRTWAIAPEPNLKLAAAGSMEDKNHRREQERDSAVLPILIDTPFGLSRGDNTAGAVAAGKRDSATVFFRKIFLHLFPIPELRHVEHSSTFRAEHAGIFAGNFRVALTALDGHGAIILH